MKPHPSLSALLLLASALPLAADSLWTGAGAREQGIATDIKAARVGDILTIVVAENVAQASSQSKTSNSASNMNQAVTQFLYPVTASGLGSVKGQLPGIKFGGTSDFKG